MAGKFIMQILYFLLCSVVLHAYEIYWILYFMKQILRWLFVFSLILSALPAFAQQGNPLPNMVRIQGGTFMMGSPKSEVGRETNEKRHSVTVSSFMMSRYEVTVEEYEEFCKSTGKAMPDAPSFNANWQDKKHPMVYVSWDDATAYCAWMSKTTGNTYRLPTEAEWEYACRAGSPTPFTTGDNLTTDQANYNGEQPYNGNKKGVYHGKTLPVGSLSANAYGLYDMHGNVWEWTASLYKNSTNRVLRGGSWNNFASNCRVAYRNYCTPGYHNSDIGFRLSL